MGNSMIPIDCQRNFVSGFVEDGFGNHDALIVVGTCFKCSGASSPGLPTLSENYFTSSDPHHDMLGGGCQVRVVIENIMGRMENLKTLISGFLGLVILVRWALVTMFLS